MGHKRRNYLISNKFQIILNSNLVVGVLSLAIVSHRQIKILLNLGVKQDIWGGTHEQRNMRKNFYNVKV